VREHCLGSSATASTSKTVSIFSPTLAASEGAMSARMVADQKFTARTLELGYIPFVSTQAEFAALVTEFTEKWGKVIRAAGPE
jgi:tripartite-type tricarboxylate transporter receptor subunit TctC